MKIKFLLYFVISTLLMANIPERVSNNIEKKSFTQDNSSIYVRDQERAYRRIVSLGEKEGLSKDRIDDEVLKLEKKYGANYEVIYKYFSYNIKSVTQKEKEIEKNKKINDEMKIEYKKIMDESKIPENIKDYIDNEAKNKYPKDYIQRVKYMEELMKFYNFIKK